jgi:hypothetical protein
MAQRMMWSSWLVLVAVIIAVIGPIAPVQAQEARSIVPYPRDQVLIETVDPESKLPRSSFCIGVNTIDVRLTNNSAQRQFVHVVNRDTRGAEQLLFRGWIAPGQNYLSALMQAQLEVTGPAGMESLRVDVQNSFGQIIPGAWMTFYVQDCGWYPPGGGGHGQALIWAQIAPYALPQGGRGTITVQTSVGAQPNLSYYFEILNSYDKLWRRVPVTKRAYEPYQLTLPVGTTTRPQTLTYTVNLWLESGYGGGRQRVATTKFSFQVVKPGTSATLYDQGYPGSPSGYPTAPMYPTFPQTGTYGSGYAWPPTTWDPYSGGMPYSSSPYMMPSYGISPYGMPYSQRGLSSERSIE